MEKKYKTMEMQLYHNEKNLKNELPGMCKYNCWYSIWAILMQLCPCRLIAVGQIFMIINHTCFAPMLNQLWLGLKCALLAVQIRNRFLSNFGKQWDTRQTKYSLLPVLLMDREREIL